MSPALFLTFAIPFILATRTNAESHTIKFVNNCGFGSPVLMYYGENVLTGDTYISNGNFSGIAYLQTGDCNLNGENCTLLEMTLINPTPSTPGSGSSTDISLIPPHVYNVATAFEYYDGCDDVCQLCDYPGCPTAFLTPNDNQVQRECQVDNVNLLITFCPSTSCPGGTSSTTPAAILPTTTTSPSATSTPASSSPAPTPSSSPTSATSLTNALTSSGSAGTTTPSSASSPSPPSVPTTSTPTTSTPTTGPTTTSSTPGALNVSTTPSGLGAPYPTNSAGGRCRPRPSSIPPIPSPTTAVTAAATTVNSVPPKQCGTPGPATLSSMRHRRARNARMALNH